jgi:hypothetical protein
MYHINAGNLPGNEIARTFEGGAHGPASISFFLVHNQPGQGPRLHQHPYDETFVILEGHVLVRVGDETVEGGPGDIVVGPPDTSDQNGPGWCASTPHRPCKHNGCSDGKPRAGETGVAAGRPGRLPLAGNDDHRARRVMRDLSTHRGG